MLLFIIIAKNNVRGVRSKFVLQDFVSFHRFTHKATMMKGSSLDNCIFFSIMAEEFISVPELLDLSRRRLRLQVIPSTVWLVLLKTLEQQPHLAHAVCDEVIILYNNNFFRKF